MVQYLMATVSVDNAIAEYQTKHEDIYLITGENIFIALLLFAIGVGLSYLLKKAVKFYKGVRP